MAEPLVVPLVVNPDRDCRSCEFYDRAKLPGAGFLSQAKPYCAGLGFYLATTTVATDCRLYTARRATNAAAGVRS